MEGDVAAEPDVQPDVQPDAQPDNRPETDPITDPMIDPADHATHHPEIIAVTRNWLERAVIGLNLCPFAKSVHVKGQVRYVVSTAQTTDALLDDLERELNYLVTTPAEETDTTLIITPDVLTDFADFTDFLDLAEVVLRTQGLAGILQVASFHPDYVFADAEADDIANHTNRAPYPTLHLIREASIARATRAFPDAADIYERNIETMEKLGLEGWRALGVDAGVDAPKP